jgi:hypothetical protein
MAGHRAAEEEIMLDRVLSYWFAHWHLRRLPAGDDDEGRRRRLTWCRDHCGTYAGRWLALGIGAWMLQALPPVRLLFPGGLAWVPVVVALVGISVGIVHVAWQIVAQSRVGLPPVDPPVDARPRNSGDDRRLF